MATSFVGSFGWVEISGHITVLLDAADRVIIPDLVLWEMGAVINAAQDDTSNEPTAAIADFMVTDQTIMVWWRGGVLRRNTEKTR